MGDMIRKALEAEVKIALRDLVMPDMREQYEWAGGVHYGITEALTLARGWHDPGKLMDAIDLKIEAFKRSRSYLTGDLRSKGITDGLARARRVVAQCVKIEKTKGAIL